MSEKRKYELKKRAERLADTRRRITEATVELHRTVGPAATQLNEVARRAGVQRMTVYNHFPNDTALLTACSAHWRALHPTPDLAAWRAAGRPGARLRLGLGQLYGWYRETEPMTANVLRDAQVLPALRPSSRAACCATWTRPARSSPNPSAPADVAANGSTPPPGPPSTSTPGARSPRSATPTPPSWPPGSSNSPPLPKAGATSSRDQACSWARWLDGGAVKQRLLQQPTSPADCARLSRSRSTPSCTSRTCRRARR